MEFLCRLWSYHPGLEGKIYTFQRRCHLKWCLHRMIFTKFTQSPLVQAAILCVYELPNSQTHSQLFSEKKEGSTGLDFHVQSTLASLAGNGNSILLRTANGKRVKRSQVDITAQPYCPLGLVVYSEHCRE